VEVLYSAGRQAGSGLRPGVHDVLMRHLFWRLVSLPFSHSLLEGLTAIRFLGLHSCDLACMESLLCSAAACCSGGTWVGGAGACY